jgi:cell division protein FtsI (penicillin-binding protein 3)
MTPVADQPAFNWRPRVVHRIGIAAMVLAVWAGAIEARLLYLQVISRDELAARAGQQQQQEVPAPAKRGEIFDRHGRLLAYSVDADSVYAVPTAIDHAARAAAALCGALDECSSEFRAQLTERLGRQRAFAYVKRRVTPNEAARVADLGLDGVGFLKESKRFYPNRELAAHLLGYVGTENVGLHGLEAAYDKVVSGRQGMVLVQRDARRQAFSRIERAPTSGASLELTIDESLQYIAERELAAGVAQTRAKAGAVVVMDPSTGEILALANVPTFNPNAFGQADDDERRNRAVQDLYEPGSTFKVVTASAAIEEKVVTPHELIDVSAGQIRFGRRIIDDDHRYGVLSFTEVIVKSSNVGAIKVGLKLGPQRLGVYVNRFGFGRPSSPDFPGESPGIVWDPSKLDDSALASVSMGYQVGVTPLQMVAAVSSIANGGTLFEPRVVRATLRDGVRAVNPPKAVRRTVTPHTAAVLTQMMEGVVADGTGKLARVPGFTVAGKTGTATKLVNGRYSHSDINGSFVGFVPSRAPALAIVVVMDSAQTNRGYGGQVAAPVFRRIAEASLRYLGVAPTVNPAPPVIVARREDSPLAPVSASGDGRTVVALAANGADPESLPDLSGLSAREAMRILAQLGITPRLRGAGAVVDQDPPPGAPLEPGTTCTLILERAQARSPMARAGR